MSTKIYNGYKFKTNLSLLEIQRVCHDIRDRVKPIAKKMYYRQIIKKMVDAYDKNQFGFFEESMYFLNKEGGSLYWGVDRYLRKRIDHMNLKQERDPEIDFDFSFSILPLKLRDETLLMLYTEKSDLREVFEATSDIEDYHYQDQTDQPKEVTDEDWKQREKDWDDALGGDGWSTPMESGFSYKPYDVNRLSIFLMKKEELIELDELFPTLEERARSVVSNIMGNEWSEKNPVEPAPENPTRQQMEERHQRGMDNYWKFDKYCRSEEGEKDRAEKIAIVIPQLRVFTYAELSGTKLDFHEKIKEVLDKPNGGLPYWMKDK